MWLCVCVGMDTQSSNATESTHCLLISAHDVRLASPPGGTQLAVEATWAQSIRMWPPRSESESTFFQSSPFGQNQTSAPLPPHAVGVW